jgi:protein-S-isoprenylcysteine O-methyltransferase Ste14
MNEKATETHPSLLSWMLVAVAWVLVGVPLLWGIFITFRKAALLFK